MQKDHRDNTKDLLIELVKTRFKLRYNNSVLGFLWVLMKPLMEFAILFVVFSALGRGGKTPNFTENLLFGTMTFSLIREGIVFGMNSLEDISHIILKINIPRKLAVSTSIIMAVINFSVNMLMIGVITIFRPFDFTLLGVFYFIIVASLIIYIVYTISLFLSIFLVKLKDLNNLMDLFLQLLFWGSGIFYDINTLQGRFGDVVRMNPSALLIDSARQALIHGHLVHGEMILGLFVANSLLLLVANKYFDKNVLNIAEYF